MAHGTRKLLVPLAALAACTGTIGDADVALPPASSAAPAGSQGAGGSAPAGPAAAANRPAALSPGACPAAPRRLVRLSASQYDNTLVALFGPSARLSDGFSAGTKAVGADGGLGLGSAAAADFFEAARVLGRKAATDPGRLDPCLTAAAPDAACVRRFVTGFGRRAFRRPLTDEEATRFAAIYGRGSAAGAGSPAVAAGIELVVRAFLVSPSFLTRTELGAPGVTGAVTLTPHERASALSYTLLDGPPDEALLQAAESGALAGKDEVVAQARRLLARPAAGVVKFLDDYLGTPAAAGLTKDGSYVAQYTPDVAADLVSETRAFLADVIWQGDARWTSVLGADHSMIDERLAKYYGIAGVTGPALRSTPLPPGQRLGLLTQGSVLARLARPAETSPVARGKYVRETILCQRLPDPPANVPPIPAPQPNVTQRQRLDHHRADPACASCHALIDPIGLALEAYDAAGRFRTTEAGKPVVTTGEITGTAASNGPVADGIELARKLAAAPEAIECLARNAVGYAAPGRDASCARAVVDRARASGGDVRALFLDLVTSDDFFARQ